MRTRYKVLLAVVSIGLLILAFGSGAIRLSPLGSGSGWEIDYALTEVTMDGVTYAQSFDDGTSGAEEDYSGSGSFDVELAFIDAYRFKEDPDGEPRLEGLQWVGLASAFYVVASNWRRVDRYGDKVEFWEDDPFQIEVEVGEVMHYYYYYAFEIRGGTESDQFPTTLNTQSAECSEVDAEVLVSVSLQETIFGDVQGFFQDAEVSEYDLIDLQLQSGLTWAITPAVNPMSAGFNLEVQNRRESEHAYTCDVIIPFSMNSGLTRSGSSLLRYDVWIEYTVVFTILLEEPLQIGTQGDDGLTGGEAPTYIPPFDWRVVLIIVVALVFITLFFFIYMKYRKGRR